MFAPATKPSLLPALDGLDRWFHRVTTALAGAWEAHRIYTQYASLSASQLAARGMTRDDVNQAMLRALDGASR